MEVNILGWLNDKMQKANQRELTGLSNQPMKEHLMADANFTLTQDLIKELFLYKNGCLFWKVKKANNVKLFEQVGSASKTDRYLRVMLNKKSYKVHRLVYFLHYGYMPKYIDHINGDTFDNRIANLRDATVEQNNQNAKIRKDSTSGIKGVFIHKLTGKWAAACQSNKKRKHLGLFDTIAEAEKAVKSYREQLHGEFARHT